MKSITLCLWVCNQVGCDTDCTDTYIEAAEWKPPAGVVLDASKKILTGPPSATWRAYRDLCKSVANVGHGYDMDGDEIEAPQPRLTACPIECKDIGGARKSWARHASLECETWNSYKKALAHTE